MLGRWAAGGAAGGSARGGVVPGVAAGGTVARLGWLRAAASGHGCGVWAPALAAKPRVQGRASRVSATRVCHGEITGFYSKVIAGRRWD